MTAEKTVVCALQFLPSTIFLRPLGSKFLLTDVLCLKTAYHLHGLAFHPLDSLQSQDEPR